MTCEAIHPTALVDAKARLGRDVRIGPYSIVGPEVTLGDGVEIGHHVTLESRMEIGPRARIGHGAVLGGRPQDLKYKDGTPSGVPADLGAGEKVLGTPPRPLTEAKRIMLATGHLPEMVRRLRTLERRLARLESHLGDGEKSDVDDV